ncbi:MAG: Uma2 family endonuclease [Gemmatimonadales bacterium]
MASRTRRWTRADLARLPDDGNRYEVLDGELFVTPQAAYAHQRVAFDIALALRAYCDRHAIGEVVGPGAVVWEKNELQPDVQVIPGRHEARPETKWEKLPRPILVVEVLSESTRRRDFGKKRDAYARLLLPTYWIVDIEKRLAVVWTATSPEPTFVTDVLQWRPVSDIPALEIPLAGIFAPATAT